MDKLKLELLEPGHEPHARHFAPGVPNHTVRRVWRDPIVAYYKLELSSSDGDDLYLDGALIQRAGNSYAVRWEFNTNSENEREVLAALVTQTGTVPLGECTWQCGGEQVAITIETLSTDAQAVEASGCEHPGKRTTPGEARVKRTNSSGDDHRSRTRRKVETGEHGKGSVISMH